MKKWYEKKRYIYLLLFIFPPLGAFLLWRNQELGANTKKALLVLCGVWFLICIAVNSSSSKKVATVNTQPSPSPLAQATPTPEAEVPVATPESKPQTPMEKIESIIKQQSGDQAEFLTFNGDKLAKDTSKPYEIFINFKMNHTISSCDQAKRSSYELIKGLYSDTDVRPNLQRVLITVPYFLRTSLGASDGVPMAEKSAFSGPTNYWKVMDDVRFSSEDETGAVEDRTWGVLFGNCIK